jgi:fatty acid desaturase
MRIYTGDIFDYFSRRLLRREIDKPFFSFLIKGSSIFLTAILLFFLPGYSIFIWPLHLFLYSCLIGPFITMYHDINHSPLFKNKRINKYITDLIGLVYGITPGTYFSHHVTMHHPENNMDKDISTTLPYQRDSLKDFFRYYFRFFFGVFELSAYLKKSNNKSKIRIGRYLIFTEIICLILGIILLLLNPVATITVIILPVVFTRTLLCIGNWGEHAFIDPNDPGNLYRNSTNIIGSYNKNFFNVGYHIGHHLRPSLHYSLLERDFFENIDTYASENSIVFKDIHYPHIWFYLVTKNYKALADKYIRLPGTKLLSENEVINLLKSRLIPISA